MKLVVTFLAILFVSSTSLAEDYILNCATDEDKFLDISATNEGVTVRKTTNLRDWHREAGKAVLGYEGARRVNFQMDGAKAIVNGNVVEIALDNKNKSKVTFTVNHLTQGDYGTDVIVASDDTDYLETLTKGLELENGVVRYINCAFNVDEQTARKNRLKIINLPPEAIINDNGTVTIESPRVRQGTGTYFIYKADSTDEEANAVCRYFNLGSKVNFSPGNRKNAPMARIRAEGNKARISDIWEDSTGNTYQKLTCKISD